MRIYERIIGHTGDGHKEHNNNERNERRPGRRIVSALLCLSLTAGFVCDFGGLFPLTAGGATENVIERLADQDTTDSYLTALLGSLNGSRYAGRIWTDKSVFSYGNNVLLDLFTDGYAGSVGFNSDFGHVFSALTSSQVVNEYPQSPIDMVIALDMSGSMGQDTRYEIEGSNDGSAHTYMEEEVQHRTMEERIKNSRIQKTLDAVNKTIDALMEQNRNNRVSVVVYGAGATVVMPLAHYERTKPDEPYLKVGGMETLYALSDLQYTEGQWVWTTNRDTCYTVVAHAKYSFSNEHDYKFEEDGKEFGKDGDVSGTLSRTVSNNVDNSEMVEAYPGYETWNNESTTDNFSSEKKELKADTYVGYFTNTQGGIYLAYSQLAESEVTTYSETLKSTGKEKTVARVPAALIMTDGGANFAFNDMDNWDNYGKYKNQTTNEKGEIEYNFQTDQDNDQKDKSHRLFNSTATGDDKYGNTGDEWYKVYLPGIDDENTINSLYNSAWYDNDNDKTLLSQPYWYNAGVLYSSDNDVFGTSGTVLQVLLTASYMKTVVDKHYTNGWDKGNAARESRVPLSTYTLSVDSSDVPRWGRMRLYPTMNPEEYSLDESGWWGDEEKFGKEEDKFDAGKTLTDIYSGMLDAWGKWKSGQKKVEGNINIKQVKILFDPLPENGYAAFGVTVTNADVIANIIYNDDFFDVQSENLGEIFDRILALITGKVFVPIAGSNDAGVSDSITYQDPIGDYMEFKNGSVTIGGQTYDMSVLLFGNMHGMVRTGIYDFQWNDEYMATHKKLGQGKETFPQGWYKGDAAHAVKAEKTKTDASGGSYPDVEGINSVEEAWAKGWVMRLDFKTLLQYVPIANADENTKPEDLSEQIKNTVYTVYRFTDSQAERNKLRMNPVYGESVPQEVQEKWDAATANGQYPEGSEIYAGTPGVYRLSDIRVWVEEYGDYVDTDGAITPNPSVYDASLYMNIPAAAVPTQLVTVTLGSTGVLSYMTNLGADHRDADKDAQILAALKELLTEDAKVEDAITRAITDAGAKGTLDEELKKYLDALVEYYHQSTPIRLFYAVGLAERLIIRDAKGNQTGVDISALSEEYVSSHTDPKNNSVWFLSNYYSNTPYSDYTEDDGDYTRGDPTVTFSPGGNNRYYVFQKPLPLYAHAYRVVKDGENVSLKPVDNTSDWTEADRTKGGNGKTIWETYGDNETQQSAATWVGGQYMGEYASVDAFQQAYNAVNEENKITDSNEATYDVVEGGIVFLTDDLLDHVTSEDDNNYADGSISFSPDDYFFLLLDYYVPDPGTKGTDKDNNEIEGTMGARAVQHVAARKGSAFGSGFESDRINNGDMLCWTDLNNHISLQIEYNSRTDTGDNTRGEPTFEKLTKTGEDLKKYLTDKCGIKDTKFLEQQVTYWTELQTQLADVLKAAHKDGEGTLTQEEFNKYFRFAVATRPGGVRVGDMFQNRQPKSENITSTAYSYYVPTISAHSGVGNEVIVDNYLGNNGRLSVSNEHLLVTKLLEAPAGFKLTEEQLNKQFSYQVYIQGVTGKMNATRVQYNETSHSWQRHIATIDVLTDNSGLLLSGSDSTRVLHDKDGKAVIAGDDGKYYYPKEDGSADKEKGEVSELYYVYLPPNATSVSGAEKDSRRIYWDKEAEGYQPLTNAEYNIDENNGTRYFGVNNAKFIPVNEVQNAEKEESGQWEYSDQGTSENKSLEILTSLPTTDTTASNFVTPYKTRTTYLTVTLEFGKKAGTDVDLTEEDLYDQIIPTADRPAFRYMNPEQTGEQTNSNAEIAKHTAEFTLRHGEGLLLTGLADKRNYRFTEKLWEPDMQSGYSLKEVGHAQQYGSLNTYKPGANAFTNLGDGFKVNSDGEPFYHSNALLWESYATYRGGSSDEHLNAYGNHHEPSEDNKTQDSNVAVNPNCQSCDEEQPDKTVRHYFVKNGDLVDPHYSGEQAAFKGNRYVVGATAHFGVSGEDQESASAGLPAAENTDYTGVYSVFGDTGTYEESAHFVNTYNLDALVVSKKLDGNGSNVSDWDRNVGFEYTVTFTLPDGVAIDPENPWGNLHYWSGKTENLKTAPSPVDEAAIQALQTLSPTDGKYTFKLNADESIVIYGLPLGTAYTVKEERNPDYTADGDTGESGESAYTKGGTIAKSEYDYSGNVTFANANTVEYTNFKQTGSLTVEKQVTGTNSYDDEFTFTVELTPKEGDMLDKSTLSVTKYNADGSMDENFKLDWQTSGSKLTATFTLKHGEKITIGKIPFGTAYTVTEAEADHYILQSVKKGGENGANILDEGMQSVSGTVDHTETETEVTLLFVNNRTVALPITGGFGRGIYWGIGALILSLDALFLIFWNRKRGSRAR